MFLYLLLHIVFHILDSFLLSLFRFHCQYQLPVLLAGITGTACGGCPF